MTASQFDTVVNHYGSALQSQSMSSWPSFQATKVRDLTTDSDCWNSDEFRALFVVCDHKLAAWGRIQALKSTKGDVPLDCLNTTRPS